MHDERDPFLAAAENLTKAKITPAMALKIALEAGPDLGLVVVVGSYDDLDGVEIVNRSSLTHAEMEMFVRAAAVRSRDLTQTVVLFAENVKNRVPSVMRQDASLILGITKCRAHGRTVPLPARR